MLQVDNTSLQLRWYQVRRIKYLLFINTWKKWACYITSVLNFCSVKFLPRVVPIWLAQHACMLAAKGNKHSTSSRIVSYTTHSGKELGQTLTPYKRSSVVTLKTEDEQPHLWERLGSISANDEEKVLLYKLLRSICFAHFVNLLWIRFDRELLFSCQSW